MPISATYLTAIQKFEGFSQRTSWDYAQYTNGFGTKARSPTETISKAEAESRFKVEIEEARNLVEGFAPNLDVGTKAALTSLTFNAGTAWMKSGLGRAVQGGELNQVRDIFVQYNKAGGQVLPGLVARRAAEVLWIGVPSGGASGSPSGSPSGSTTPAEKSASMSSGTASQAWTRDVFDPIGHDVHNVDKKHAAYPASPAIFGEMSTQFLAQLSLDIWDFLSRADAAGDRRDKQTDA